MQEGMTDQSTTHVPAEEGRSFWLFTDLFTIKAAGEDTGEVFALAEQTSYTRFSPPPHIHHREDESYYILDLENVRRYGQTDELREKMQRAGVADRPDFYFLQEVERLEA
jgi:hypothetical protein